jgi:hypothetical protein
MAIRYSLPEEKILPIGEGITRTNDPKAKLWPVTITFTTGLRPMRTTIKATGPLQAEQFARARHPYVRSVAVEQKPV